MTHNPRSGLTRVMTAVLGIPAVAIAGGLVFYAAWASRLPERIAVHWQNGEVDGYATTTVFVAGTLVAAAVLALGGAVLGVVTARRGHQPPRGTVGFVGGFATFPVTVLVGTMHANLSTPDAGEPLVEVALAITASIAAGALAAIIGGRPGTGSARGGGLTADKPSVGLAAGERAVWVGGTTSPVAWVIVGVGAVGTLLAWFLVDPAEFPRGSLLIAGIGCLLACAVLGRLTLSVDASGVTVRLGVPRIARRHVPLERISSAETDTLNLFANGGLGIRVNPVTGDTAYKLRGGPALVLNLTDGKRVLVSVDKPEHAAGLVNDLLRAGTTSPDSSLR